MRSPLTLPAFSWNHLLVLPILAAVGAIVLLVLRRTPEYRKGDKLNKICMALAEFITLLLFFRFGWTDGFFRGIALIAISLFGSVSDIRSREVSDVVSVMILLAGIRQTEIMPLLFALISAAGAFAFMLVCAILTRNHIGGADVKFTAAWFFVLGIYRGTVGLLIGLFASLIGTAIRNAVSGSKDKFLPLIPYLSAGFIITYFF